MRGRPFWSCQTHVWAAKKGNVESESAAGHQFMRQSLIITREVSISTLPIFIALHYGLRVHCRDGFPDTSLALGMDW